MNYQEDLLEQIYWTEVQLLKVRSLDCFDTEIV